MKRKNIVFHLARPGFTLAELLAATILSTLMLAAVLGVLTGMTRQQRQLEEMTPREAWQTRFVNQLEWDLVNSRMLIPQKTGFQLRGYAGKDPVTGTLHHKPTLIEYIIHDTGESRILLRKTASYSPNSIEAGFSEVVAFDVSQIKLTSAVPETVSHAEDVVSLNEGPIPAQVAVLLFDSETSLPILTHAYILQ